MKTIGIIAEYNPFHLGHKYLIDESRIVTDAERVVVVMSGNSVQRGDFAIVDKFARAREAIQAGADLVLELPFCYSSQSAEFFAFGASKILHSLGLVDYLCFGSETNNADSQWRIANLLYEESPALQAEIKEQMKKGINFPAARQSALEKIYPNEANYSIMNNPNDILAIEYIKSLFRLQSSIEPISVQRIGGAYYDPRLEIEVPSATAIRECLMQKKHPVGQAKEMTTRDSSAGDLSEQKIKEIMNDNIAYIIGRNSKSISQSEEKKQDVEEIENRMNMEEKIQSATTETMAAYLLEQRDKNTLASIEDYYSELSSIIIRQKDELDNYFEVSEGIDNLLRTKIFEMRTVHDLAMEIKSKRYTYTRARRMLMNILVGLKKEDMQIVKESDEIPYARILAFNDVGRKIIKECSFQIELINKLADFKAQNPLHQVLQKYDEIVGELFYMKYEYKHYGKRVYTDKMTSPVYISDEKNI